jgi:hypothetical protein
MSESHPSLLTEKACTQKLIMECDLRELLHPLLVNVTGVRSEELAAKN